MARFKSAGTRLARARLAQGGLLLACWTLGCRPNAFDDPSGPSPADASLDADSEPDDSSMAATDAASNPSDAGEDGEDAALPALDGSSEPPGTELDATAPADAAQPSDATQPSDAAPADTAPPDSGPSTLVLPIGSDRDDALWRVASGGLEELLHFSEAAHGSAGYTIEVGVDGEQCRAGLRFALPIERGARVLAASLRLSRVGPNADPGSTMRVHVYDAASVGPFDHAHVHQDPAEHASGGLWLGASVGGYHVGSSQAFTEIDDLAELVQHVIDRPDWVKDGFIGFVLGPDEMDGDQYAQFRDSFAGVNAPALTITFQEP
jgi:hypothetical protein